MVPKDQCPYGPEDCPKVRDLRRTVEAMARNQVVMMRLLYTIAGIVSVTLGVGIVR